METQLVSAALFIVMILLLLVVYDSNATMQAIVRKVRKPHKKEDVSESHQEVTMEKEPIAGMIGQQAPCLDGQRMVGVPVDQPQAVEGGGQTRETGVPQPINVPPQNMSVPQEQVHGYRETITAPSDGLDQGSDKKVGAMEWYVGVLRKLFKRGSEKQKTGEKELRIETPAHACIPPQESVTPMINALQGAIADLTNRLMQTESAVEKIAQLEGDVTRVGEETEMVAEEMKDILGTIRTSIDGFDSRLNQVSSEIRQLQEARENAQPVQTTVPVEAMVDEETKLQIKRLQEAVADMTDTIEAMPEDIRTAMANSQNAVTTSQETNERLEVIWENLQSTPGFGARKTFRCESCGSQGYIASPVSCSKCGTPSWFGWWPPYEEIQGMESPRASSEQEITDGEEISEMASLFGTENDSEKDAEIQDLPDIDDNPEVPDIAELAKMIEEAGIADRTDEIDSVEPEETTETDDEIESVKESETEVASKDKSKPRRKTRKAKKK